MADEAPGSGRVTFGRGYNVWLMAIDGTWRRSCILKSVSNHDARLSLETSIEGLHLKEFFLLLSSTGLAYRRCELIKVNGAEIDIRFLNTKGSKSKARAASDAMAEV